MSELSKEGDLLGRHFLGRTPNKAVISIYNEAIKNVPAPNAADKKLLIFALRHRWSIGYIDAGLALINPQSEFRHRLYIMFAVLESNRDYSNLFLPKQRSPLYFLYIMYVGLRSIFKGAIGFVLVKAMV